MLGDLSGVSVEIDIPEVDITEIKPGMPATVRGVAFGKQALKGKLVAINAQASASNGNALPSFTALVEVKSLTETQQTLLKVGMSAAVELSIDSTDKLLIPLAAIQQKNGKSMVEIQTPDGKTSLRPVTTGPVNDDSVVIESGLKAGGQGEIMTRISLTNITKIPNWNRRKYGFKRRISDHQSG